MRFQVAQLSHQLCRLDHQRLEQQSDILATAAALHANGQLWPMIVGGTLLSFLVNDFGFLAVKEWVSLTACCAQFRKTRTKCKHLEHHHEQATLYQLRAKCKHLEHKGRLLDQGKLELQSAIAACTSELAAVVGGTLISYLINDPGHHFLEVQDWVRLTACSTQAREMRRSADHGVLAAPAAEELGFRLLTQRQNSRGVKLQRKVPGGPLVKARTSSCHHTTHRAWSFYLPEFKLNKGGQVVRKLAMSPERQQSLRNLCVTATAYREASQSDNTAVGRAGSSESHHLECDYGSSSSSSHSAAAQCPRHPPITFFGMNRHLVRPLMPCTCSV